MPEGRCLLEVLLANSARCTAEFEIVRKKQMVSLMLLNYNWPQSITTQVFYHLNGSDYLLSTVLATVLILKTG